MSRTLLGGLVRAPRLRLRLPALEAVLPSETSLQIFFFATYFLVTAGVIYDILTEVPAMGAEYDQQTGAQRSRVSRGRTLGLSPLSLFNGPRAVDTSCTQLYPAKTRMRHFVNGELPLSGPAPAEDDPDRVRTLSCSAFTLPQARWCCARSCRV
jgi:hypothetical protein